VCLLKEIKNIIEISIATLQEQIKGKPKNTSKFKLVNEGIYKKTFKKNISYEGLS